PGGFAWGPGGPTAPPKPCWASSFPGSTASRFTRFSTSGSWVRRACPTPASSYLSKRADAPPPCIGLPTSTSRSTAALGRRTLPRQRAAIVLQRRGGFLVGGRRLRAVGACAAGWGDGRGGGFFTPRARPPHADR